MAIRRPFRFGVQGRSTGPLADWLPMVKRVEELGYSTYLALDHFVRGLDPVASLMAAAMATERLRIGSFVFDNDFRHPALLAKAAASLDVLSGGRFELGLGAGWLKEEYDQTGIPFDVASVRIERMEESIAILKLLFTQPHPVSYSGPHYTLDNLICPPHPVQKPHPPLLVGGGSKRVLTIAGREANIVGITTRAHADGSKDTANSTAAATARKIDWVREAAGDHFENIELNIVLSDVILTDNRQSAADDMATRYGLDASEVLESPQILIGTHNQMAEQLQERRERFGFSYVVITEPNMDAFAPVVAQLAGT